MQQPAEMSNFNIPHKIYKLSLRDKTNQSTPALPTINDRINAMSFEHCLYEHWRRIDQVIQPFSQRQSPSLHQPCPLQSRSSWHVMRVIFDFDCFVSLRDST